MPEMDTLWSSNMAVIPQFQQKARNCGATAVKGFGQAMLLAAKGGETGICYGLSVGWVISKKKNDPSMIDQAFLSANSSQGDEFYNRSSGTLHNSQYGRHTAVSGPLQQAGLTLTQTQNFGQHLLRERSEANFITGHAGYHILNTPNHAMAAAIVNGTFTFFDPNLGEATFVTARQFKSFFIDWIGSALIVHAYRGTKGGKLDEGGSHKTLRMSIDWYT